MNKLAFTEKTVAEIVALDYRTSGVFAKHEIDFCCNGDIALMEVCTQKNLDISKIREELAESLSKPVQKGVDYDSWPIDLLTDYIEKKHHRYVGNRIPEIVGLLEKLCQVHGEAHPELFDIKNLFTKASGELTLHMKKEELMLFPFIRKMQEAEGKSEELMQPVFGSVENPVEMMKHEHNDEGEMFRQIRTWSNDYEVPADGCNTYKAAYQMLEEFEADLHLHIHLENNILFPKAISLEKELRTGRG